MNSSVNSSSISSSSSSSSMNSSNHNNNINSSLNNIVSSSSSSSSNHNNNGSMNGSGESLAIESKKRAVASAAEASVMSNKKARISKDDQECSICFNAPQNAALIPCGHTMCQQCAPLMKSCPICSCKPTGVLSLFSS